MQARWLIGAATVAVALVQVAGTTGYRYRSVTEGGTVVTSSGGSVVAPSLGAGQFFRFGRGQQPDAPLTAEFDEDGNGRLDATERVAARERAEAMGLNRGRSGRRGMAVITPPPGARVTPEAVRPYPTTPCSTLPRSGPCSSNSKTMTGNAS